MVFPHTYRTEHTETKTTNAVYGDYYAASKSRKIAIQPELLNILQYIDSNRIPFFENLSLAVKIKSITSELKYRDEVHQMISFTEKWLQKLDIKYELFNIGFYVVDDKRIRIPPVILAAYGKDPKKKTVVTYLHLDVPKPDLSKWDTDPWTLTTIGNKFYGNGASCGKGPMMMWLHVIEAFKESKMDTPVNIKFVIEFMNHENSNSLAEFLATRMQDFFCGIYNVVVCESEWLGEKQPCIIYGCVGVLDFQVTVEKNENSSTDIHEDMENIFKNLCDNEENIIVKGFSDPVDQITPDEEKIYENIKEFDPEEIRDSLPPYKRKWSKVKLLMSYWRLPSIILHDVLECVCDKKDFSKIKRMFTVKIVPKQTVNIVERLIKTHVQKTVNKLKTENKVSCELMASKRPWFENFRCPAYNAARRATIQIYKEDPNMIREARGREAVTILDRILEKNIVMLPLGCRGSSPGEANENISSRNFYEGTKLIAAYLFQLAYLDTPAKCT